MKLTGENRSTRVKTCPSATLSTTNPTSTDPGSNPGLRGERLATNRLNHGTATSCSYQTDKWAKPGNLKGSKVLSEIGEHWTEKYFQSSAGL
jgi:hypothetical protein